jgi:hypothetical protein
MPNAVEATGSGIFFFKTEVPYSNDIKKFRAEILRVISKSFYLTTLSEVRLRLYSVELTLKNWNGSGRDLI